MTIPNFMKTLAFVLGAMFFLTSCDKEDTVSTADVENYVDETIFDMQERGNCGRFGCYEFVFPITIAFGETSTEIADFDALKEAIKNYRESNPDGERPTLGFPLEVISQEGEVISVASQEELHELRIACRRDFFQRHGHRGHGNRGMSCFKVDFPHSILLPDETVVEVNSVDELKLAVRTWKSENPGERARPVLVFPVTVTMEDGTSVEVESKEALVALKEECSS